MSAQKSFFMIRLLSVFLLLAIVTGCTTQQPLSPAFAQTSDALLRLAPGDKINLIVYGEETLTGPYMLDEDGNINIPLAGIVKAGGLTKSRLQQKIAEILVEGGFQQKPYVTVEIAALRPFYINGEVNTPGSYPYQPTLDVFQAVAVAGGFTPRAATSKVVITRTKQNGEKVRFNAPQETPIWPGDSILVEQRLF